MLLHLDIFYHLTEFGLRGDQFEPPLLPHPEGHWIVPKPAYQRRTPIKL